MEPNQTTQPTTPLDAAPAAPEAQAAPAAAAPAATDAPAAAAPAAPASVQLPTAALDQKAAAAAVERAKNAFESTFKVEAEAPAPAAPAAPAPQDADLRAQLVQAQNELAIARAGGAGLSSRLIAALAAQVQGSTPEERAADARQLVSEITSQVRVSTRSPEDAAPPLPENPMDALREGVMRTMNKLQAI